MFELSPLTIPVDLFGAVSSTSTRFFNPSICPILSY